MEALVAPSPLGPRVEADWRRRGSLVLGCVTLRCGFRCLFALADKRPVERRWGRRFSGDKFCNLLFVHRLQTHRVRESAARGGVYKMGTQGAPGVRAIRPAAGRMGRVGACAWLERDRQ